MNYQIKSARLLAEVNRNGSNVTTRNFEDYKLSQLEYERTRAELDSLEANLTLSSFRKEVEQDEATRRLEIELSNAV